jgi:hypothetical protein
MTKRIAKEILARLSLRNERKAIFPGEPEKIASLFFFNDIGLR